MGVPRVVRVDRRPEVSATGLAVGGAPSLHECRSHIWALWAAATGALYPWHGLSQVLDRDPHDLPPGIRATVAGLDHNDLRQAARASAAVRSRVSDLAATAHGAELPTSLADFVTALL